MEERTITITEALGELKLLDSRITKETSGALSVVGIAKKGEYAKVGAVSKSDFIEGAKSKYASVNSLIALRAKIKAAVVISNATTPITVNGVEMSVADAIERKVSISYEKALLERIKMSYLVASTDLKKNNDKVDAKVDEILLTFASKDSSKKSQEESTEASAFEKSYRKNNEYELVDPIGAATEMLKIEERISGFESAVNTALTISNSKTTISI